MPTLSKLLLPPRLEAALLCGHPWVYRDQVPAPPAVESGWVAVECGRFKGFGFWDAGSALAVRIFSTRAPPDTAWFRARVAQAWQQRQALLPDRTNGFRWINGEGDGIPGIVVDYYGGFAVVALDSRALEGLGRELVPLLREVAPLKGVFLRHRAGESAERRAELLWGREPPQRLIIEENGLRMYADLLAGQKTGLFLDQRDHRALIERLARGRRVLNLFACSGEFSLYAARGGAQSITSVDIAPRAIQQAQDNFCLNGFDPSAHEFAVADAMDFLRQTHAGGRRFDLVICDPPSLAHRMAHVDRALEAYTKLNAGGFRVTAEDALYAASSCTSRVTPPAFERALAMAASRTRRSFQVLLTDGQPFDHPSLAGHPEGRYLKFVLGRVGCL